MMTTTPATPVLLPVTPEQVDRQALAAYYEHPFVDNPRLAAEVMSDNWRSGASPAELALLDILARHRELGRCEVPKGFLCIHEFMASVDSQAHSLPGDVGTGWVVGNSSGTKWRCWGSGGPDWTEDRDKATRYARRIDAERVHAEDDDAWRVEPFAVLTPSGLPSEMAGHDLIPEGDHARALIEVGRLRGMLAEIGDDLKAMPFSNIGDKLGRWHLALIGKLHDEPISSSRH